METKPYIPKKSMKWYKFLKCFGLPFFAIIYALSAFFVLSGRIYGYDADYFYELFSGLDKLDLFYGLMLFVAAVFCVITWISFLKKGKDAPNCLTVSFGISLVVNIIYIAVACIMLGELLLDFMSMVSETDVMFSITSLVIANTVFSALMVFLNIRYFKSRKNLFE